MRKEDFFCHQKLITTRKKPTDGSKVFWLNTNELMLKMKHLLFNFYEVQPRRKVYGSKYKEKITKKYCLIS